MKKTLKKILPILKRSFALMGVVTVLACSFVIPSAAVDFFHDYTGQTMRPLFDYDYLEVYYDGGYKAVFNLKDVFYSNFMMDNVVQYVLYDTGTTDRSITFTLSDLQFEQANINIGGQFVNLPYWSLYFDIPLQFITNIKIGCSESIYDYNLLSYAYSSKCDMFYFYDENYNTSYGSFYYSNNAKFLYPVFAYDANDNIVGRSLKTKDLAFSTNSASSSQTISPGVSVDDLYSLMPSNISQNYFYFSDFITSVTVPSDACYMRINIFYVPTSSIVTFKEYHDLYFPSYRTDNVAVDFSSWLNVAVGGFLSFEFVPGISLGTLLLFMIGIGAFSMFLKFFAGG